MCTSRIVWSLELKWHWYSYFACAWNFDCCVAVPQQAPPGTKQVVAPPAPPPPPPVKKSLPLISQSTPKPAMSKPAPQPVSPPQPPPPPPEVCLRWNSYHSNMQATFPSLLSNEQFVDVTLACEGRSIKCHKVRTQIIGRRGAWTD